MTEQLTPGEWIGGFEIVERLRSGGMATMYLARRHGTSGFSRRIALKVIHPHLTYDSRFVNMFVDEARICSQISHPNVVHVEELGVDRGLHYLAMEYIEGCSLNDVLRLLAVRGTGLAVELATRMAMQIAAGLHAAHETVGEDHRPLGIVHRDISPSNILLSRDGHIKVIDFGVAKARGRLAATSAAEGTIKGKLRYMSPEQALRQDIDRRSDIYSLGVVYWELLTGTQLFSNVEDEVTLLWKRMANDELPRASSIVPDIPAAIDDLVAKMLARDPAERFATAWECRRAMCELAPRALAVDTGELAAIVTEIAALPPPEGHETSEPSPVLQIRHRTSTSIPRVIVDLRTPVPELSADDEIEITIHPRRSRWRRWAVVVTAAIAAMLVIALWPSHKVELAPLAVVMPTVVPVMPAPRPAPVIHEAPPAAVSVVEVKPTPVRHRVVAAATPKRTRPAMAAPTPPQRTDTPHPISVGRTSLAGELDDTNMKDRQVQKPTSVGKTTIAPSFEE